MSPEKHKYSNRGRLSTFTMDILVQSWIIRIFIASSFFVPYVDAVQCFSCKGNGLNEVAANIHCLENGYLENCDDFYEYYTNVEDKKVLTDAYYYDDEDEYYYDEDEAYYDSVENRRQRREVGQMRQLLPQANSRNKTDAATNIIYKEQNKSKQKDENTNTKKIKTISKKSASEKLPKDPEHHCYSSTIKVDWEQYHVEKGCRKIDYCRSDADTKPEWTRPWNFCCDKSRCNAKQVKDKPQRIYGMNCRRTDDCIQGHVTRSVCPHLFKSCPKIPPNLIKMECVAKGVDPTDVKERYRNPFQEKKCMCTEGSYPKGPICTSAAWRLNQNYTYLAFLLIFKINFYF